MIDFGNAPVFVIQGTVYLNFVVMFTVPGIASGIALQESKQVYDATSIRMGLRMIQREQILKTQP